MRRSTRVSTQQSMRRSDAANVQATHTTHGVHLNTQGVRLSLYQRYRYSLSSGTQGAGAVRYGPSPGTGGAGTGHPPVPPVHGALRCSMAGVPADFKRVL